MGSEIKKMKQGMAYSCKEKTIILNVFRYFKNEYPDKCVTELVRRTAKATGCSEKSVFQFRKEEASAEGLKTPSKTKIRKSININSRSIKYDESVRQGIRNIIYELKCKNVIPSLNTILKNVHSDSHLPNFSLMTLRRLLCDMGFSYEKVGNKSILMEKGDNDNGKNKKVRKKIVNPKQNETKEIQRTDNPATNQHVNQNCIDMLQKPIPQHPVSHINTNINMHLGHMSQPVDQQMPHHPVIPMPPPYPTYNHSMMGQTMHIQPPLSHNMHPLMLNHRPQPNTSHIPTPAVNIYPSKDGYGQGI